MKQVDGEIDRRHEWMTGRPRNEHYYEQECFGQDVAQYTAVSFIHPNHHARSCQTWKLFCTNEVTREGSIAMLTTDCNCAQITHLTGSHLSCSSHQVASQAEAEVKQLFELSGSAVASNSQTEMHWSHQDCHEAVHLPQDAQGNVHCRPKIHDHIFLQTVQQML